MTPPLLTIDHIGVAVAELSAGIQQYQDLFGARLLEREEVPAHSVSVAFLELGGAVVELLAPTSADCTLAKFLQQRGPGLHHLAYKVTDIVAALDFYKNSGAQLIDQTAREGSRHCLVAFLHPRSCGGVLWELCQPL